MKLYLELPSNTQWNFTELPSNTHWNFTWNYQATLNETLPNYQATIRASNGAHLTLLAGYTNRLPFLCSKTSLKYPFCLNIYKIRQTHVWHSMNSEQLYHCMLHSLLKNKKYLCWCLNFDSWTHFNNKL